MNHLSVKFENEKLTLSNGSPIVWRDRHGNKTSRQLTFGQYAAYWATVSGWMPPAESAKYNVFKTQQRFSKKKLSSNEVERVKVDFDTLGATKTAEKYGVSKKTVYRVVSGKY